MAAITMQRDLVLDLKKETVLNVGILSKLQGMPQDIARQVLRENGLDKPTQNLFNHLSHYFVCIIDPKASEGLPWPLYDSKTERTYRNELAKFISNYSNKGVLTPVMTSYLVNPNCYKVTLLIFQMSQLAVQKLLDAKINEENRKKLNNMTAKYKSQEKDFIPQIEAETERMLSKFSNYLHKRKTTEKMAEKIRTKISEMESKLETVNAQKFLNNIVDGYISKYKLDSEMAQEYLTIKNVHKPAPFFDRWLSEVDRKVDEMDTKWSAKVTPFLQICSKTKTNTESLIARHTGEADKESYMIEYNHKTDALCTNELQNQVNSEQKYILKNIVKEERLNFPNLIRGFLIAISFILQNGETSDEIYKFNEYLEGSKNNYNEVVIAMRGLVRRVMNAEARLEPSPVSQEAPKRYVPEIPTLPDLSDIHCNRELMCQTLMDNFTPLSMSKHQFNLLRRTSLNMFVRPQPKMFAPFSIPRDDFVKNRVSYRANSDLMNTTQNFHNVSIIQQMDRANETISGCSTGCTKQQLLRLLSTKKTSSSKKFKHSNERNMKIKKARLFDESTSSNESNCLFRSHSSPNLYENRETRQVQRSGRRKLSIMQESSSPLLEVSGIVALEKDSSCETSRNQSKKDSSIPKIRVTNETPPTDLKFHQDLKNLHIDLDSELLAPKKGTPIRMDTSKIEKMVTPIINPKLPNKTNSLEKIINRYKKIRATVLHEEYNEKTDIRTIVEEKENMFTANKILLPDLLSPSCSVIANDSEEFEVCRKPRESLGTALGVDDTFLDQFDLID